MSNETNGTAPVPSSEAKAVATDATGATAAAAATGDTTTGPTAATKMTGINTMAQLESQYPQLYKTILLGLAQNIIIQMNDGNNRLIAAMKKLRENDN